jgi:hypothetical protein
MKATRPGGGGGGGVYDSAAIQSVYGTALRLHENEDEKDRGRRAGERRMQSAGKEDAERGKGGCRAGFGAGL